ncbi:Cytosol aminopeptidase, catalytic domain [Lobulomyces angularis]|nr:Cytosol aminopeptidase, catalytic domain [Lobulomyces angularis]
METTLSYLDSIENLKANSKADSLIVLFHQDSDFQINNTALTLEIKNHLKVNNNSSPVNVLHSSEAPNSRLILVQLPRIKELFKDNSDVKNIFAPFVREAIKVCLKTGSKNPILFFPDTKLLFDQYYKENYSNNELKSKALKNLWEEKYENHIMASLLAVYQEIYEPLQAREHFLQKQISNPKIENIQVKFPSSAQLKKEDCEKLLRKISAIEEGNILARDVGGSDPERMTPQNCGKFIKDSFKNLNDIVSVTIEADRQVLEREYPLLYAVCRASMAVPRHHPCVVRLEYKSDNQEEVTDNLFFSGKGVTFDTGGADLKVNGAMRFMSRDKCGATGVAGFFKALALLKPKNINATALLGFVRNSIGPDSFVSDEIITSRNGTRDDNRLSLVLIGNTDAEGRLVMCDLLCKLKEEALKLPNNEQKKSLFTVATLTGHVIRAYGPYTSILENGPAKLSEIGKKIKDSGEKVGQGCELTNLRGEDFQMIAPGSSAEDVIQTNDKASSATPRGHQFPAAFLSVASGLCNHGLDSTDWLNYLHVDIAGSAEELDGLVLPKTTGSPISSFVGAFC